MTKQFDIDLRARGSYKTNFGESYLKLKQYFGVDGAWLIKRVFSMADEIISYHKSKLLALEEEERRIMKEKLKYKAGL